MDKRFLKALRSAFRSRTGFTLVEVMVALSILAFGMLGIAAMFSYSNNAFGRAAYINTATDLAYNRVSDIKMCSYTGIIDTPALTSQLRNSTTINGVNYLYNYSTSQIGNLQAARVKVIIRWATTQSGQGNNGVIRSNHVISLTTITTGKMSNYSS